MISRLGQWGGGLARRASFPRYTLRKHLAEFAASIGPVSLLLDVGSGRLSPYRSLFATRQYVGIDFFESAHVTADAGHLPVAAEIAAVVLMTEVLEHLPFPTQALQEIHRVLQGDGHLVVSVPLMWGVHDYVDYQRWTEQGLRQLLQDTGFEVMEIKPRGGIFSMIGCMMAQVPAQLFGEKSRHGRWWTGVSYRFLWALLSPLPWILALFDRLDRRQEFTLGYSVLCRKVTA